MFLIKLLVFLQIFWWKILRFIFFWIVCISTYMIFSIIETYVFDLLILLITTLFSSYLGVTGVFFLIFFSNFLFLYKLIKLFFYFNGHTQMFLINFGTNAKISHTYKEEFCLSIDFISYNFSLLTIIIATFVTIYAFSYMRNEPKLILFLIFLKGFVLSMITLLWASNWFMFILGWELIGITSFFLINFWNARISSLKSAFKAFIFNKLSDSCLIINILLIYLWDISGVFTNKLTNIINLHKSIDLYFFEINYSTLLIALLVICAFCKSAQFGFHTWLPDSMEAPVPASALIHSATLVSAGVYLMLRCAPLLINSSVLYPYMLITSFTAFYGAIISSFQTDLKKILAYSTISHCGFLMFSIVLNEPSITILYLYGHGFFKSLSFIGAGNLIQHSNNYQDSRRMGSFVIKYVFEFFFLTICLFNLSSFPFFFNFFSKHFLFSNVYINKNFALVIYTFLFLAAFSGVFYSLRVFYLVFFFLKKSNLKKKNKILFTHFISLILNRTNIKNNNWLGMFFKLVLFIFSVCALTLLLCFFLSNIDVFLETTNTPNISSIIYFKNSYNYINIIIIILFSFFLVSFILFKSIQSNNYWLFIYILTILILSL